MVTSSKILTVSYGTFSCTLEGFDDPFTTLQMVAEYFRRLAAEDRYFGGAPQTPDPETLKRIAEDNSSKGVAAELADDGVILRQTGDLPEEQVQSEVQNEVSVEADEEDAGDDPLIFDSIRNDADGSAEETVKPETRDPISTAVNQAIEEETNPDGEQSRTTESVTPAKVSPLAFFSSRRFDSGAIDPEDANEAIVEDTETPETRETVASEPSIDSVLDAVEKAKLASPTRPAETQTAAQKSVEETLAAIRLNVEQAETSITEEEETAATNESADDAPLVLEAHSEDAAEELIEEVQENVEEFEPEAVQEPTAEPIETAESIEVAEDTEVLEEVEEQPVDEAPVPEALVLETPVLETPVQEAEIEEVAFAAETQSDNFPFDDIEPEVEVTFDADVEMEPETEIEIEAETSEIKDEGNEDAVAPRVSSLTDEEEAELAADLRAALEDDDDTSETEIEPEAEAGIEAETGADPELTSETVPQPDQATRSGKAHLLRNTDDAGPEDEALDRLLQTTQSKMDKPEQQRRMNALDQLKAAVAATEADKQIRKKSVAETHDREEEGETADLAAYREDLRRAQNSARLEGQMAATPKTERPPAAAAAQVQQAPLLLVSEQRVDEAEAEPFSETTPEPQIEVAEVNGNLALKPSFEPDAGQQAEYDNDEGEIQGIPADAFSDATDFGDFAERIGAFELTDLLEASAAYTSIVEGKSRFSRAQVMSKLAKLNTGDAYTKEAGLRSFGKLLREGKILRVQDGQFGISKASRFSIASRYHE